MKIKLKNNMSFNIEFPETVETPEELKEVIEQVNNLGRFMELFNKNANSKLISVLQDDGDKKPHGKRGPYTKRGGWSVQDLTKEQVIEI
jgi:hypothetical protein